MDIYSVDNISSPAFSQIWLAPSTLAPSTLAPITLAPSTLAPSTLAPSRLASNWLAQATWLEEGLQMSIVVHCTVSPYFRKYIFSLNSFISLVVNILFLRL